MLEEQNDLAEAQRRFEEQKMNRRAALRKLGFTTGAMALSMFSLDDLARIVSRKIEKRYANNAVVNAAAEEFKEMGVAFASAVQSSTACCHCVQQLSVDAYYCQNCASPSCLSACNNAATLIATKHLSKRNQRFFLG